MVSVPLLWPLFVGGAGEMIANRSRGKRAVVRVVLVSSYMTREAFLDVPLEMTNPENATALLLRLSSHNQHTFVRHVKIPDSTPIHESKSHEC